MWDILPISSSQRRKANERTSVGTKKTSPADRAAHDRPECLLLGEISEGTPHSAWKSKTSLLRINSS